jgi:hypothetical protein
MYVAPSECLQYLLAISSEEDFSQSWTIDAKSADVVCESQKKKDKNLTGSIHLRKLPNGMFEMDQKFAESRRSTVRFHTTSRTIALPSYACIGIGQTVKFIWPHWKLLSHGTEKTV